MSSPPAQPPAPPTDDSNLIFIIAAAAGGGVLLCIFFICCYVRNRRNKIPPPPPVMEVHESGSNLFNLGDLFQEQVVHGSSPPPPPPPPSSIDGPPGPPPDSSSSRVSGRNRGSIEFIRGMMRSVVGRGSSPSTSDGRSSSGRALEAADDEPTPLLRAHAPKLDAAVEEVVRTEVSARWPAPYTWTLATSLSLTTTHPP